MERLEREVEEARRSTPGTDRARRILRTPGAPAVVSA